MAREISYFVQAFNAGKGGELKADAPIACKSATGALRTAERLALSKLGVVAFSSKKARERMIEDRDAHAKVLAAPFDRDKAERARSKFTEIQALIDALDRAISGEEAISPKS